jgi:hypothetical protein
MSSSALTPIWTQPISENAELTQWSLNINHYSEDGTKELISTKTDDAYRFSDCVAGSRPLVLELEVYGTGQTVLLEAIGSHVQGRPAARKSFRYSISGELKAGGNSIL